MAEIGTEGDAFAAQAGVQQGGIIRRRGLRARMVPRVRPGHDPQHQRGVRHGAGHRPVVRGVVGVGERPVGHPAVSRLQAKHAAEMRRQPDRARAVAALVQRAESGRRRGTRPGRGSPGAVAVAPRVMRDAGERAVTDRRPAELGRRGLAEHDRPRLRQPRNQRRVLGRNEALAQMRAVFGRNTLGLSRILDRDGNAVQRADRFARGQPPIRRIGRAQRLFAGQRGKGIDPGLQRFDPPQERCDHLGGRDLLVADQTREVGGRQVTKRLAVHRGQAAAWPRT